jgi:hypothetical protein
MPARSQSDAGPLPFRGHDLLAGQSGQGVGNVKNNDPSLIEPIVLPRASGDGECGGSFS